MYSMDLEETVRDPLGTDEGRGALKDMDLLSEPKLGLSLGWLLPQVPGIWGNVLQPARCKPQEGTADTESCQKVPLEGDNLVPWGTPDSHLRVIWILSVA